MQSASIKTREGKIFKNENMPMIVQSKAMRNVILFLVPGSIQQKWIENYIAGKQPFENTRESYEEDKSMDKAFILIEGFSSLQTLEGWFRQNRKNLESRQDFEKILEKCKFRKKQIILFKLMELGEYAGTDVGEWLDIERNAKIAEEAALGNKDAIAQFKADMEKPEAQKENVEEEEKIPF